MSDYVDIAERIAPYTVYPEDVTTGPDTQVVEMTDYRAELIDTHLRLVAAILDRNGVSPTIKADALTEIERIRELVAR